MFHSDFEEELPYQLLTVLILVCFYGIYFGKMLIQRRRGIRTNQIGRRKEKGLHTVETLMKTATYAIVPVQLLSVAFGWSYLTANARFTGFVRRRSVSFSSGLYEGQLARRYSGERQNLYRNRRYIRLQQKPRVSWV